MNKPDWESVKDAIEDGSWQLFFDERQCKEIRFDRLYANEYSHGTDGHNARLIIAKMADLLDVIFEKAHLQK